ncbi:hypothetical protein EUA06_22050 [Nocardioides glacieisoli]|uniref:Aminoglycoside phosphotransferase domain-containing protein n=1 Tax=Nocardioides glacieisoli TaxID=1168730 RepID=A0A4Q2RJ31_9ACTN|nr:hypothetical protein EUA06_22050 [Nocardioides glacieisoli]
MRLCLQPRGYRLARRRSETVCQVDEANTVAQQRNQLFHRIIVPALRSPRAAHLLEILVAPPAPAESRHQAFAKKHTHMAAIRASGDVRLYSRHRRGCPPCQVAAMDDDLDERQTVDGVAVLPTTADAVSASVACARALGLPADDPEVIAEGYSVRVRLRPAPVVTRVVTVGRALRPHPLPWLEREVLVAQFLAASGVPIVAPWEDPGPHIAEGLEVCLWHWTEHDSREVSAAGFGAMLGPLHDALARYPGDLPTLIGPLTDISPALAISSDPTLHRAAAELVPLTRSWPARPLHGDAHTGNVLMTPDGPLWTDFEDVCVGPVEWDMASMTITDDALAAYPGPSTGPDSPTAVTCAVCRSSPASWSGTTTTLRSTRRWSRTSTDASTTDPACEGGPTGRSLRGTTARPGRAAAAACRSGRALRRPQVRRRGRPPRPAHVSRVTTGCR